MFACDERGLKSFLKSNTPQTVKNTSLKYFFQLLTMCIETCAATLIEGLSAPCFDKKNEDKTNGFKTPRGGLLNNVVIDFPIIYFSILALLAQLGNRLSCSSCT